MKIVVVIPTYNEAQNIIRLVPILEKVFKGLSNHEMHALVVDDNSPDGTGDVVNRLSLGTPWLHLLTKPTKEGIGAAYFYGFRHAMREMGAGAVVEMDGDLQHDPNELPNLIAPLEQGYDHIIGSRFIKGGSIPREWQLYRKFLSVVGNIFTKLVLGIYNVNDFTTGYKVTRVKGFLDSIDFDKIRTKSFAYKLEILYRLRKLNAKIKQVPIKFGLRDRGVSKIETGTFFDTLLMVLKLRTEGLLNPEFLRFCVVGGVGFITDAGLFNLLNLKSEPKVSAIMSGFIAMIVTFVLNNSWSFGSRKIQSFKKQLTNLPRYLFLTSIPILFRSKLVALSILWFGQNFFIYNFAFLVGVGLGLIWNYFVYSKIIWKKLKP